MTFTGALEQDIIHEYMGNMKEHAVAAKRYARMQSGMMLNQKSMQFVGRCELHTDMCAVQKPHC